MEFGTTKNRLLRVLRSDLTGLELKTGRGNTHLLDTDTTTSDDSGDISSSPDSGSDFVVHTHEVRCRPGTGVTRFGWQLEANFLGAGSRFFTEQTARNTGECLLCLLCRRFAHSLSQKEITELCERDLQYRTEIIELLTARLTQLESETTSWKSREKELFELKEKMQFMEQLYGGEGARELEFGTGEQANVLPEGHMAVEITYLEDLKSQIQSNKADMEQWRIRVEKLEASLAEEQGNSATSRDELSRIREEHKEVLKTSEKEIETLKRQVEELLAAQAQATTKNAEVRYIFVIYQTTG